METNGSLDDVYLYNCPTRQVLDRIGDKWTVLVIGLLREKTMRFSEIRRCIGGISQKILTQTLRNLERDGLVTRTIFAEMPPRVEYMLTPLGETLIEPLMAIYKWSETHIDEVMESHEKYDRTE